MSGSERKLTEEARRALLGAILTEYDEETKTWGKATLATDEFEKVERAVAALEAALAREQAFKELAHHFFDELVGHWHDYEDDPPVLSVAAFLGLTDEQYAAFVEGRYLDAAQALAAVPVETQEADDYSHPGWRMFPVL